MNTPAPLGYAHGTYDRAAHWREDDAKIEAAKRDARARILVFCGDVPVLKKTEPLNPLFALADYPGATPENELIFLGLEGEAPRFATTIDAALHEPLKARGDLALIDLRSIMLQGLFDGTTMGALATAKALMFWHRTHGFCSQCGKASQAAKAGWQRNCPACEAQHFPRTDPVVIMLAVDGDQCLMGRQSRFQPGWYSCLAGFMEPGETLEAAVRREIMEEAGIATGAVRYLFSQPWPFPESLMIGCLAEATSREIVIDGNELEDARWFSRQDAALMLAGTHPDGLGCPAPMAIAHQLLRAWLEGAHL